MGALALLQYENAGPVASWELCMLKGPGHHQAGLCLLLCENPQTEGRQMSSQSPTLSLSSDSGHSQESQYHRSGLACALEHGCCVL